jgi:formate-dependent nitrite reductase cytochrome c552 subunit
VLVISRTLAVLSDTSVTGGDVTTVLSGLGESGLFGSQFTDSGNNFIFSLRNIFANCENAVQQQFGRGKRTGMASG